MLTSEIPGGLQASTLGARRGRAASGRSADIASQGSFCAAARRGAAFPVLFGLSCVGLFLPGAGCATPIIQPNLSLLPEGNEPVYRDKDWATVLSRHVKDGRVDYEGLTRDRESLERYYALVSVTGPTRTPKQFARPAAVTAYWINVYNASVLCAVMERYPVESMHDASMPRLEYDYPFRVDGRVMTLAQIQQELFEQSKGDVRTLLALSQAAMGSPRLSSEPMRAETLDRQLAAAAASALDDPALLRIDYTTESVLVYDLIFRRQADFVAYWRRTRRTQTAYAFNVLIELASREQKRALQTAVGYTLRRIAFDRRLNQAGGAGVDSPTRLRVP